MKYHSQRVAYWFFASAMLLLTLQIVYGFIMGFARVGMDGLHEWIPFNTARATHTNLLVVWLLCGFMGAAYFIIPEEVDRELWSVPLAYVQLISLLVVGVIAIVCYHLNIWEGRKFLEIPRPLDYLVVVNVLAFLLNIGMTLWTGKRNTTTSMVLYMGLLFAALLYLPGMVTVKNQTVDSFYRWWVVHLWVEGVWELIMGGILCLPAHQTHRRRSRGGGEVALYHCRTHLPLGHSRNGPSLLLHRRAALLADCGRHLFSPSNRWPSLGMAIYALAMAKKGGRKHPNRIALTWSLGCAVMSFVGAGFLGMAHTLPQINMYTHGTLVTAMHGHLAFWGAYAMIVLAMIAYALPLLTGRKLWDSAAAGIAFWTSNIGMVGMTGALAVAGVTQVVLERRIGMDFLLVQKELEMHFVGMLLAAALFTVGIGAFIVHFVRHGLPSDEALDVELNHALPVGK
jgi:nitric oxide reductase subunit B